MSRFIIPAVALIAVAGMAIATLSPGVRGDAPPASPATAPTTRPSFKHPAGDAALRFQAAIAKGDTDAAVRATADSDKPLTDQPMRISQLIAGQKNHKTPFVIHDVQVDGDLAAAIVGKPATIGDKAFESDIWFLVRQAGEWRVLPDYNVYDRLEYGFDADRLAAYKKLEERAEKRTAELHLEITGCSC